MDRPKFIWSSEAVARSGKISDFIVRNLFSTASRKRATYSCTCRFSWRVLVWEKVVNVACEAFSFAFRKNHRAAENSSRIRWLWPNSSDKWKYEMNGGFVVDRIEDRRSVRAWSFVENIEVSPIGNLFERPVYKNLLRRILLVSKWLSTSSSREVSNVSVKARATMLFRG